MNKVFPTSYLPKKRNEIISLVIFSSIMLFLFLVDLITKVSMYNALEKYIIYSPNSHPYVNRSFTAIPGLFDMTLVFNNGAAWNMLADQKWILSILSILGSLAILYVYIFYFNRLNRIYKSALILMFAGCFGNMIDRIGFWANAGIYKYGVIDFIQFHFWKSFPVFNFADAYLVIGIIVLIVAVIMYFISSNKVETKTEYTTTDNNDDDFLTKLKKSQDDETEHKDNE